MHIAERILSKSERDANMFLIRVNGCIIILTMLVMVAIHLQTLEAVPVGITGSLLMMCVLLLGTNVYIRRNDGKGDEIRYIEFAILIVCAVLINISINLMVWGLFYLVPVLAARYNRPKFTLGVGVISSVVGFANAFALIPVGLKLFGFYDLNYLGLKSDYTAIIHPGYMGVKHALFRPEILDYNIALQECFYENFGLFAIGLAITFLGCVLARYTNHLVDVEISNAENEVRLEEEQIQKTRLEKMNEQMSALSRELTSHISEMTRANASLQADKLAAEAANRSKETFLSNVTDTIHTPIGTIMDLASLIDRNMDSASREEYLSKIQESADYLLRVTNKVFDLHLCVDAEVPVNETLFDMFGSKSSDAASFVTLMQKRNVQFIPTMDVRHRYMYMDIEKVNQIMVNLLSNAVKFSRDGGTVWVSFIERPSDRDGYLLIETRVADNGSGMDQTVLDNLFDYYSAGASNLPGTIHGSGLGMSVVKRLVDLLGGEITVHSTPGKGTEFVLTMYHRIAEDPQIPAEYSQRL